MICTRPDQYGCIPQSSTTHALINLIHQWSKATDGTSSDVRVLIMDYRKAFDLIDHSLLITKLKGYQPLYHQLDMRFPYG